MSAPEHNSPVTLWSHAAKEACNTPAHRTLERTFLAQSDVLGALQPSSNSAVVVRAYTADGVINAPSLGFLSRR
jgi:hypothetical protein